MHKLVDQLFFELQHPVTIESRDFELLAYSGHHDETDEVRMRTILSKRASAHVFHYLHEHGWMKKIEQADRVVSIPPLPEIDLGARAVVCLKHAGKVYGYLWVQVALHDLTDEQRRRIEEVAKEAAQILHEQMGKRYKRQEEVHDLFLRFIQYRDMSERDVQMELQLLGVTFPSRFAVVVFHVEHHESIDDVRQYVTWVSKTTHAPIFFIHHHHPFLLIVGETPTQRPIDVVNMMITKLQQDFHCRIDHDVLVGIGNEYNGLQKLRDSYKEAMEVIHLKKHMDEPLPHAYRDLGIYRIVPFIYEQYKQRRYKNEAIMKLKKHDEQHGTDFLHTLRAYIQHDCNMKQTAESLYIHPNTLHYRLKRMQSITTLPLHDFEQRMMLYIDLLLYKYKESVVDEQQK
ncbi:transcriptional regulator [Anoxybacillus gonensis]|uniref:Helix-turn-helix domain-containing protein n=1 Tax=Anoxybacillus gonensis TaxID=198467 RepID=A0AAW7TIJ1_9BACL|nr:MULTISPECIES: helix-turn-helix domain-containing protein [Anoxybacillus]AKS38113.1 transcriptional regulator [Anoxybacillus gonensis]KGP60825.1 transcriptional regulator [Anoxybacillus gonensis]MBW9216958.1 helix-turn-helix domain-containing protein [Anoxybacillus sp. ST70]MDO0877217.1 helix-turn-helix domain-containing protein [Anoxybacillus gonensis]